MRSSVLVALAAVAAVILATTPSAAAQPGITAPLAPPSSIDGPPPPLAPLPKARPGAHRPGVALVLGFGSSIGLLVAASRGAFDNHEGVGLGMLVIAPSVPRWYIGEVGVIGMAMRGGGLLLLASAIGYDDGGNPVALIGGAGLILGGVVYDMLGPAITADRQNKRRWAAMPTAVVSARGDVTPGLGITARF